ncbi:MAG: NAD-dependent epimerase/dehydratase family protein [Proteobacteria bacterium]|nr:NAD-dependent epimerase/dehydratase family protein [Pseudomonadota bacterium]
MDIVVERDLAEIVDRPLSWERLSGCRIAVTGAGGFLGGYVARTLLALHRLGKVSQPLEVVALVRSEERARSRFADSQDVGRLRLQEWDLNTIALPQLHDCQYVFHVASQASPRYYGSDPVGTLLPNTVGTAALLEALRRGAEPRGFVFVSSSEVYGASPQELIAEGDYGVVDPTAVRACYAEGKRAGEAMCVAWNHQYGLPTFIVRPFHTYGPGLTPEDGRVFSDFAFDVVNRRNIVMNSAGDARRAFCYVADAIAGFFHVLLAGEPATAYNVANRHNELSVMELAQLLVALYPERGLSIEHRFESVPAGYLRSAVSRAVPDTARLEGLGWEPRVTASDGFRRMIDAHSL